MQTRLRPYATAGVALVGASVIAIAPAIAPPPLPDITVSATPVSSQQVELSAFADALADSPITAWVEVFATAFENGGLLAEALVTNPAPVLRQILANQIGYAGTVVEAGQGLIEGVVDYLTPGAQGSLWTGIESAFDELRAGDFAEFAALIGQALFLGPVLNIGVPLLTSGILDIPGTMANNFADVITTLTNPLALLPLGISALGIPLGAINAFGDSIQLVIEAFEEGDPMGAVGALINTPAMVTGAVLNGYQLPQFEGLLSGSGLLQSLLVDLPRSIADALGAVDGVPTNLFDGLSLFSETGTASTAGVLAARHSQGLNDAASDLVDTGSGSFVPVNVSDDENSESDDSSSVGASADVDASESAVIEDTDDADAGDDGSQDLSTGLDDADSDDGSGLADEDGDNGEDLSDADDDGDSLDTSTDLDDSASLDDTSSATGGTNLRGGNKAVPSGADAPSNKSIGSNLREASQRAVSSIRGGTGKATSDPGDSGGPTSKP